MKTIPLLKAEDIEIKIKQVCEKGAIALLYKTARVDMAILDEVFGAENWETDYKEIKGNLYCGKSIGVCNLMSIKERCGIYVYEWTAKACEPDYFRTSGKKRNHCILCGGF